MNWGPMNWSLALPEIVLACCGMAILIFGVLRKQDSALLCTMLTLGSFLITGVIAVGTPAGVGYGGLFVTDAFTRFVSVVILFGAAFSLVLALDYDPLQGLRRPEFPVLALFATVGMLLMVSAANLMTLYLGLELHSLALYVMAAFARDNVRSSEAGLKYFVLSSLASGLLLYGISLTYGFTGTMSFANLAQTLHDPAQIPLGALIGMVFIVAGLAFKVSAVPFHMWTPDVYQGAPTPVTAFFGTAPKVAAMALLVRTLSQPLAALPWNDLIVLVSLASMILGSFAAIAQRNVKRLMAYSSIGHMGYALIGLAAGGADGVRGVLIYLLIYVFMNIGVFGCIIAMRRGGRQVDQISDLAGLGRTDPAMALALAVFMFSMAGIPPLAGFFAKFYVFLAAVQKGYWTLAILGVVTSVVGAVYYLRIVKVMYFDAPESVFDRRSAALSFVMFASALFIAFFFITPDFFINAANAAAKVLIG
jgi:NADH-quinone oxidoreductase subunit N